jgi:hypothetical protein
MACPRPHAPAPTSPRPRDRPRPRAHIPAPAPVHAPTRTCISTSMASSTCSRPMLHSGEWKPRSPRKDLQRGAKGLSEETDA